MSGLCRDAAWLKSYVVGSMLLTKEGMQVGGSFTIVTDTVNYTSLRIGVQRLGGLGPLKRDLAALDPVIWVKCKALVE
jgi:hypothetical protein